jgi:acetolactate synthase I/II/III large subunit
VYTTSTALLEALQESGIAYIFANFGSDHPALIEAIAQARAQGRPIPQVITCPNEMVGLTCAHGFAQVTGRAQAVVVHVDCGTQALAGAVHNAAKARVPVLIFAGLSPFTQEGELRGSRNEFIQWIQDVNDQRGIVRQYMKYDVEIRSGRNVKQLVHRALQFATSDPKGPVYLVGAREVMEEEVPQTSIDSVRWRPVGPAALPPAAVDQIIGTLSRAKRPLVVTSYLGRHVGAVAQLQRLCVQMGIGVLESVPNYVNYPHNDGLYLGNQWNQPVQNDDLASADVVLVIDSDVPWIPTVSRPATDATIFHIDIDPLKSAMPLWYLKAHGSWQADSVLALTQLNDRLDEVGVDRAIVAERTDHYRARHAARAERLAKREQVGDDVISPEFLTACVRRVLDDDCIVLNEGITNYPAICDHIAPSKPGSFFSSGGGSLGWSGGAAIGIKLAQPAKTVVALTGDGSYLFSVPSSVHWMARRYAAPFLQVVYNNRGWKAPRFSALAVHGDGYASRASDLDIAFDPPPDYAGIAAAAGGALALQVRDPAQLEGVLQQALRVVRDERRAAVVDVWLSHLMEG